LIRDGLVSERLMATLSGCFGVLAIVIASVGLYGVMSYSVVRRRMEIGIRLALGAERHAVVRMMLSEAGVLVAAGGVIGAGLAVGAARSLSTLLFGLTPGDPLTLALALGTLAFVSLVATWLPA